MKEITTARLSLSAFLHEDAPFIIELLNSPGWLRFIGDRQVKSTVDAIAYLDNGPLKSYQEHGFGIMRVALRATGEPIGMCGLLKREDLDTPDIGFAFFSRYEGQGFAHEAASSVIQHARTELGLTRLSAIVQPDNTRSVTLLKKLGFQFEKAILFGPKREALDLYRLPSLRP